MTRTVRRLPTCLLAVVMALAYAAAGENRAVAATVGSWRGAAPVNDEALLGPVARATACPGRPIDGPARVRLPLAIPPARPWVASLAPGFYGAPSPFAWHLARHFFESGRTSRGPPPCHASA